MEAELEEETETLEKSVVDKNLQKSIVQNDEEYLDSALPVTPLRTCRFDSLKQFLADEVDNHHYDFLKGHFVCQTTISIVISLKDQTTTIVFSHYWVLIWVAY